MPDKQRKIYPVFNFAGSRSGHCTCISVSRKQSDRIDFISDRLGFSDLLLFPGVLKKCEQALFGESDISGKDVRDQELLPETEEYMAAEKGISYLYMPVM